jgi:hypothetical protein
MEKIPTAQELLKEYHTNYDLQPEEAIEAMKKFAELHVKAALKAASEKGRSNLTIAGIEKKSILEAYPLENIK